MLDSYVFMTDDLRELLLGDPVCPHIDPQDRVGSHREVLVLRDNPNCKPRAVLCVAWMHEVPRSHAELFSSEGPIAILYSIWSLSKGYGRVMVEEASDYLISTGAKRIVTMSPKTVMARDFHLSMGAEILQVNDTTVNYEYNI